MYPIECRSKSTLNKYHIERKRKQRVIKFNHIFANSSTIPRAPRLLFGAIATPRRHPQAAQLAVRDRLPFRSAAFELR